MGEQKCDQILAAVDKDRIKKYDPVNLFDEIRNIAKHLFSDNGKPVLFQNKDGFCFKVGKAPMQVQNSMSLEKPTFIYDHAGTMKNNVNADAGLSNYGPYDSITGIGGKFKIDKIIR
ncbi:MAG TPA: hypothetical protein VLZ33_06775 [Dysgonamonadaceae bacterium]|nr:hypothetical protein [Dysgonamonadaceae bacterium]